VLLPLSREEGVMADTLPALHPFSPLLLMVEGVEHTLPAHQYIEQSFHRLAASFEELHVNTKYFC